MIDLQRAPQTTRREIVKLNHDGDVLALHMWLPKNIKGAIFYFHGLQSHAGWLWEVGPQFADNDVAFFVLDRRGSGLSDGERHELPDVQTIMGDYSAALGTVREMVGHGVPLSLFGHCLGGSFMAALMHHDDFSIKYDAAIFCSTWLGRLHSTLSAPERQTLANDDRTGLWDAGLKATDFSNTSKYVNYIDNDDLAVRHLTHRSRATLLQLEELYLNSSRKLPPVPSAYISGPSDPIVDLDAAHRTFLEMTSGRGSLTKFPTDKHYLFYTDQRNRLVNWASIFTLVEGLK